MVGLALALRLALLRGSLTRGPGSTTRRAGVIVGATGGAFLALLGFGVLAAARGPALTDLAVVLFTVLVVGWTALPVLTFAGDDLMDPARLALLPLTRRQLLTVLSVAALVGVAPVCTLLACLGLLVGSGRDGGWSGVVIALVAVLLQVALCVSVSRLSAVLLSGLLRSRRGRDIGVAAAAVVALSFQLLNPVLQRLSSAEGDASDLLARLAAPLRVLPSGLLATAPGLAADGRLGLAVLRLSLVAGLVVVTLALWQAAVVRSITAPDRSTSPRRLRADPSRLPRLVPPGRIGAVAAKDLRYLRRDPRRSIGLVTLLLLPLVIALGPVVAGSTLGPAVVFAVCGIALFAGGVGSNRFGADGTATWLLVSSQQGLADARRELLGGDLATTALVAPAITVVAVVLAGITDGGRYLAPALGLAFALLGVAVGGSGLPSVLAPFAVPEQPTNLLNGGGAGVGLRALLLTVVQLLGTPLLCLPLLFLLLPALDRPAYGLALLVVGPVYGLLVGAGLRELAARAWTIRGPEVLQVLSSGRS